MSNYIISTDTHSPNTPSDHTTITTKISATPQVFDPPSRLIWAHTIWTSPDPNQVSVEKDLINSHILKKLVESPPSDVDLFSERLSQELSKIRGTRTHTATRKPMNKPWWTPELNKVCQQLAIQPTPTTQERIEFNKLRLEYKRQIKITKEASLRVHLDNMEEPEIYRWLSPSDNFPTIITPIQDSLNITCTTPTDISKVIIGAHYPACYDIPLPPLTFDLPTNFEVTSSDVSTALMNVSQTAQD
jgi:hypothetical protein